MPYVWVAKNKELQSDGDAHKKNATLVQQFDRKLSLGDCSSLNGESCKNGKNKWRGFKYAYGDKSIGMWFSVGLVNDYHIPSTLTLKRVSLLSDVYMGNKVPLVLVNDEAAENLLLNAGDGDGLPRVRTPWKTIAENVLEDLISSFHNSMNEFNCQNFGERNPGLVVRFGKVLFQGNPSFHPRTRKPRAVSENALRSLRRNFHTTIPPSYVDNLIANVLPAIGFDTEVENEKSYRVKLSDSTKRDAAIVCECKVTADGERVELYKVEMNQVRHLVVDVSCFGKDIDMRLMVRTKRNINTLNDMEVQSIRHLISSAVLDSNEEGGLRWPIGMTCHGQRFQVTSVWHSDCFTYEKSSMGLRIRNVNRFDYKSSTKDFSQEVVLKLTGIDSKLKEENYEESSLLDMLKDNFKVIWEHFLTCNNFLKCD